MQPKLSLAVAALALTVGAARAETITFETLAAGTVVSDQFPGVTFTPNAFSGPGSSSSGANWATNTNLTVVSSTGSDVGGLGTPSLVSGNILRSFNGWLGENGDASFRISFSSPITTFSATFAGVNTPADVTLWAYNGATQVRTISGVIPGQIVLSLNATSITSVVIRPGSTLDWVGVDNITWTPAAVVPEAGTWAMMGLGLAVLAFRRRQG